MSTSQTNTRAIVSMFQENMARRRSLQRGHLYRKGPSWILRWREDVRRPGGSVARKQFSRVIGPATGPGALSKREAERIAWDEVLSRLDRVTLYPHSLLTVEEFVEQKFLPDHVAALKPSGQMHYRAMLRRVLPAIGHLTLREVSHDDVRELVRSVLDAGLSVQTAKHLRNTVSAIFRYARVLGWHPGPNPAEGVRLPPMARNPRHALSVEQCRQVLAELPSPSREVAVVALFTGCNVAELAALRWGRINLTLRPATADGVLLPPRSLLVAENYYRGHFGTLKTGRRYRVVPLPQPALQVLAALRPSDPAPEDLVFVNRRGRPIDAQNLKNRQLIPAGERAGLPFRLTWHVFRRSTATLLEALGMPLSDRQAMLGHAMPEMTLYYSIADTERRRVLLEELGHLLFGAGGTESVQ